MPCRGCGSGSRSNSMPSRSPGGTTTVFVQPMPRRSLFRDSAAIAGGVTAGTAAGHVVGEGITSLFGSGSSREREVLRDLPRDYVPGERPSGPCAYEIGQFIKCAEYNEDLNGCQYYRDLLRACKHQYGSRSPSRPSTVYVQPMPQRRSMFRDAASIAGGVTVGTAAGHVVGEGITRLFGGGSRRETEVIREVPRDYVPGSRPSGPCAYEIGQFVKCAEMNEDMSQCQYYRDLLRSCKQAHGIP